MRGLRFDRILAGTALALVLALPESAMAQIRPRAEIPRVAKPHAATRHVAKPPAATQTVTVPQPEQPPLPPPTAADIDGAPVNAGAAADDPPATATVPQESQAAAAPPQ